MDLSHKKQKPALLVTAVLLFIGAAGCGPHTRGEAVESSTVADSTPKQARPTPAASDPGASSSADSASSQKKAKNPPATQPDLVGSSTVFIGWSEELPILRQEDTLSNGRLRTSFLRLNLEGSVTTLDPNSWHGIEKGMPPKNPPGLTSGKLLVQGAAVLANNPLVTLKIDADKAQMDAMQKALDDWNDGKRDASEGFPSVNAALSIQFLSMGHSARTLWKNSTTLGVAAGEAGFEYSEPSLSFAVLSASQKHLYFEIRFSGDNVEHHLVAAPEEPK